MRINNIYELRYDRISLSSDVKEEYSKNALGIYKDLDKYFLGEGV